MPRHHYYQTWEEAIEFAYNWASLKLLSRQQPQKRYVKKASDGIGWIVW